MESGQAYPLLGVYPLEAGPSYEPANAPHGTLTGASQGADAEGEQTRFAGTSSLAPADQHFHQVGGSMRFGSDMGRIRPSVEDEVCASWIACVDVRQPERPRAYLNLVIVVPPHLEADVDAAVEGATSGSGAAALGSLAVCTALGGAPPSAPLPLALLRLLRLQREAAGAAE